MSEKEKYLAMADEITSEQMVFVVNMVRAFLDADNARRAAEEEADERIALAAYERYINDPEGEEFMPIEEYIKQFGMTVEELENGKKEV